MMNRLIKNLGVNNPLSLKTIVAVEGLTNHDMIYVYHHIQRGSMVNLKSDGTNVTGDPRYSVKYRGFLLGFVTLSGIMKSFFMEHNEMQAEIATISKDKFMPINRLDIQIGVVAMKKVG